MGDVHQLRTKPIRENVTLRFLLLETLDLMGELDYANEESRVAAQVQIETVRAVLTGQPLSD